MTAFHVELDVLCDISLVLRAAFTGGYKESQEKSMRLPEEDVTDFERFMQWTYLGRYQLSGFEAHGTADQRIMELARLYTVADRFDVIKLKHHIIDRVYEIGQVGGTDSAPPHEVIRYMYENSTRLSFFRKLMAAWYLNTRRISSMLSSRNLMLENEIPDLQADVAREAGTRGVMNPFLRDRRVFYEDVFRLNKDIIPHQSVP